MENKITILFFLPNLSGGGAERVAVNFIRQLDINTFNIVLVLVSRQGVYESLIPDYVDVYDLQVKKTIFSLFKIRKIIQELRPDIVFSTLFRTHYILYLALVGMKFKPLIVLRSPNSPKLVIKNKQISLIQRYLLNRSYSSADLIIAQTPEMKEELIKFHNVEKDKIIVFLNPIDKELIDKSILNVKSPFNKYNINIVAAGRLNIQKGFDILLKAFKEVVLLNKQFVLHIIGADGGEKDNLIALAKRLKIDKNVIFLDFQENPYRYFFYSDLYVLSSRWEGMPNTVLENLYLKKPIIATACIPFMNTLIEDKKNGFIIDIEDEKSLSKAIINYKNINTDYKTIDFDNGNIGYIFTNLVVNNK
jgi:glycosyltransferase involved in cell wall biosynthesis